MLLIYFDYENVKARGAGRSAKGARGRPEGAGVVVGHHAHRAQRLDPLDHLRKATGDSHASDQQGVRDAHRRETARVLLRRDQMAYKNE